MLEIAIVFGIVLAIVHYFSEGIVELFRESRKDIVSFIAGISITFIFLLLMPEVYRGMQMLDKYLFMFILIGFAGFHLIEKKIYQNESKEVLQEELRIVHSVTFFLYHFLIGFILLNVLKEDMIIGVLFFAPIVFHTAFSGASLSGIHVSIRERMFFKTVLSCSTLAGTLIGYFFLIHQQIMDATLGFVVGALLYIVIRDSLPRETKGSAAYFILGIVIYSFMIVFVWLFGL